MGLDDLGEFGLIARLAARLGTRPDVLVGIGDDAAVLDLGPDSLLVATVDAQVAGQHFRLEFFPPEAVGHKALAVNLSDIAAMGAEPLWALVSLMIPPETHAELLDGIYTGMTSLANQLDVAVVGGNITSTTGPLTVDVTLLGRCARGAALTRSGARPGDLVLVTGTLGAASAGFISQVGGLPLMAPDPAALAAVNRRQMMPWPRVREGRALAALGVITAMTDISDGLVADLGHICDESGCGVTLESASIPIDPAAHEIAAAWGHDAVSWALTGGEDYELVCCVRPDGVHRAIEALAALDCPATIVGQIEADVSVRQLRSNGQMSPLPARGGWDHFASRTA